MITSYINEYHENKYVSDSPNIVDLYSTFLSKNTPFLVDTNQKTMWCDELKTLGLRYSDGMITIVNKFSSKKLKSDTIGRTNFKVYIQRSSDGNVWYLRDETTPYSNSPVEVSVIIAKTVDGWAIFSEDIMATKSEFINLVTSAPTNDSALYTIQKMVAQDNKSFLDLYKVFFAGNFTKTSTVIVRDNILYRVVSVDNDHTKPSFAFPVSEAVWDGTN